MKILLIEDEHPAARQLTKLIATVRPEATIIDVLDTVEGSVRWLRTFPAPDLVFMDIQIADGMSFDIFNQVEVVSPVIFTTAFDQYAVQAFKVNAVDYLLKPVDPEELGRAFARMDERTATPPVDMHALVRYFRPEAFKDRFLVKTGAYMQLLPCADIAFFHSADGLTQAYTHVGKKHFVDHTLDELEDLINPRAFFRVSRSLVVALESIRKVHPHLNGRLKLDLQPEVPGEAFVSRERAPLFKTWLGG